jgi:hypothetical protein
MNFQLNCPVIYPAIVVLLVIVGIMRFVKNRRTLIWATLIFSTFSVFLIWSITYGHIVVRFYDGGGLGF